MSIKEALTKKLETFGYPDKVITQIYNIFLSFRLYGKLRYLYTFFMNNFTYAQGVA